MDEGTPTKPPRGVKQYKEPSGLLMSVIRTLSTSETDEQRDKEKGKLERDYKKSNKKLEELVSQHDRELTQVMQLFVKVSSQITSSREKIRAVKNHLQSCKTLLRCRRDELKKLWLEGIEYKHALLLLEKIDQLRDVPSQLGTLLSKKQYLPATQLLMSALTLGDGNLDGVEALAEVRNELQEKKQILHSELMKELRLYLYLLPTSEALNFRRQGSSKEYLLSPFLRANDLRGSNRSFRARRRLLDIPRGGGDFDDFPNVFDEADDMDLEERTEQMMSVLVECLSLLQKIPEAVETIKAQMQSELIAIIARTTSTMLETQTVSGLVINSEDGQHANGEPQRLLLELLETSFDQFRKVANAHSTFLRHVKKSKNIERVYDTSEVWNKIQTVFQLVLTDYLDAANISGDSQQAPAYSIPATDISSYFSKRKTQRQKKVHLFRFDSSSPTVGANSYVHEPTNKNREKKLVCVADVNNITIIFIPLHKFIQEIEEVLRLGPGNPCTLNTFISDFVKDIFVKKHHHKVSSLIDSVTKAPDAWKSTTNPGLTKKMGLTRPLLQSTVAVERSIVELRELMRSLPNFADHFLSIICNVLRSYRETCQAAYRGIVQPDPEDKRICSVAWLKDDDFSRFIKSLPNWTELQAHKPTHRRGKTIRREETTEEESPEDIRQRNVKEAEMLASNMGESGISAHEILSNIGQLKKLAQLHESMEWFAAQVLQVIRDVKESLKNSVSDATMQQLYQSVHEFTDLADICLLVLHLEVRVQCFHYLLPKAGGSPQKYDYLYEEPDPRVLKLSRVLTNMDEAMVSSLQPRKTKYIFEGLGHLIAKILISSSQYMEKIDENGIQRMCRNILALQQTLANITSSREVALDHAKQYFDMFYQNPEEILSSVLDKGAHFTDMEYINAIQLLCRTYPDKFGSANSYLQRLSDILGEIGVTV